jgi:hypothetical protein
MADIWEEGYASKELLRRSAALLQTKDDLENRRKKTQKLKQAVKKEKQGGVGDDNSVLDTGSLNNQLGGSSSVVDQMETDLDLATESESIRVHLDQLKR